MTPTLLAVGEAAQALGRWLPLSQDRRVLTASGAEQALALLAEQTVGAIVTDQNLPGAVELLAQVRERWPETMRLLLAEEGDSEAARTAVEQGLAHAHLPGPRETATVAAALDEAFEHHRLLRERRRLAEQIETANAELQRVNQDLRARTADQARELQFLFHYDGLTRLPNRLLYLDQLDQALSQARRTGSRLAVLVLNLNRFKSVNETFGHAVGDELLQGVGQRLSSCVRDSDTVAHAGADEFTFLLPDVGTGDDVAICAQRILESFRRPFELAGREVYASASLGAALFPADGEKPDDLLKNANTAMHHARELGGHHYQFYIPEMSNRSRERLFLESSLRRALEREEFVLHYQPQVDLASGAVIGIEALLRWQSPEQGLRPPAEFLPVLEETGLIEPVGEWVLWSACRQGRAWRDAGLPPLRLALNLSAYQFRQGDLAHKVRRILDETGLDPTLKCIELELTETMLMRHAEETLRTLVALHEMGIQIAIDDFGTGYSSFSYLRRFPIDALKIDRSFVQDIGVDPGGAAIVRAIIAMGHTLKLRVIAEGVETPEQLAFLRAYGCDEMQGYLFSRPQAADRIGDVLLEARRLS